MTERTIEHSRAIDKAACENCHLLRRGCPERTTEGAAVGLRSWCSDWTVKKRGPKGAALAALTGIPRRRP